MSAYFSNMESKCERDGENPERVAFSVITRMAGYIAYLIDTIADDQRPKLDGFLSVLLNIHEQEDISPVDRIRSLHTLAHDIGHGKVALRTGGFAGDNPYYRDNFSTED